MKKITIGRNNLCDVIVEDTTDHVSRKQAVLTFSFFGRMMLYDTSNNGTYVNGQKLEKGKGVSVTRKDKVNFAKTVNLDWSQIKDPYRNARLWTIGSAVMAAIAAIVLVVILTLPANDNKDTSPTIQEDSIKTENTVSVKPAASSSPNTKPQRQPRKKKNKPKQNGDEETSGNNEDNRISKNAPIVY